MADQLFWVYEAEYRMGPNGVSTDWTNPDPDTVDLHGPFETFTEAKERCAARYWSLIDKAYHRPVVVTNPRFDPRDRTTHDFVVNPDLYWDRIR